MQNVHYRGNCVRGKGVYEKSGVSAQIFCKYNIKCKVY